MKDLLSGRHIRCVLHGPTVEEDDDAHGVAGCDAASDNPLGFQVVSYRADPEIGR